MRRLAGIGFGLAFLMFSVCTRAAADTSGAWEFGGTTVSGTGFGNVATLLTIQNMGTEDGCVGLSGAAPGGLNATGTGLCGSLAGTFGTTNEKPGVSHNSTPSLSFLGITDASQITIVFNVAENDKAITLQHLVLVLYRGDTGAAIYTSGDLAQPAGIDFDSIDTGTGTSGVPFTLANPGPANSAILAFVLGGGNLSNVYIGLRAQASGAAAGQETFYVGAPTTFAPVPEPATFLLLGSGLVGVGAWLRRRNRAP